MAARVLTGIDLIEIDRVAAALLRHPARFRARCFTDAEVAECDRKKIPAESYAGRFAAKEAVGKLLGTGMPFGAWRLVEVLGPGRPRVILHGRLAERARRLGVGEIDVSITHSRTTSACVAVALVESA